MGETPLPIDETTAIHAKSPESVEVTQDKPPASPETTDAQMKEMVKSQLLFADAIHFFPEDEQEEARKYLDIRQAFTKVALENIKRGDSTAYDLVGNFCNKDNIARLKKSKLYHLFVGSGIPLFVDNGVLLDSWQKLPMDTPGGEWKDFIENEIEPLISKEEKPEIERPAAAA